jgi:diguanylate cyclase (GGDEF)-like protein
MSKTAGELTSELSASPGGVTASAERRVRMARVTKVRIGPAKPEGKVDFEACLVHIYPTGAEMGTRYPLAGVSLLIGRDPSADITINNPFVSRNHACIQPNSAGGYDVVDLQSTNGVYVNENRCKSIKLKDGDYLRIGNYIYRYLEGGNVETQYHEEILRLTIIDGLTGMHNQRYLRDYLDAELPRSAGAGRPVALAMMDIDHFKQVNDTHGHLGGDYALRELTQTLRRKVRGDDLFARYGGEEFALVMPNTDQAQASQLAEELRAVIAAHHFCYEGNDFPLTISIGIATALGEPVLTSTELIQQADERLYQAKLGGRNRVVG